MKILKWNVDKNPSGLSCRINKAIPIKDISYVTLSGEKVCVKASDVRKKTSFDARFGRVAKTDLT